MKSRNISSDKKPKEIEEKLVYEKFNSNYILKIIFDYMKINKSLNIVRHNKNMQNRLELSINDYIDYYLKIKFEMKIVDNKYGRFITIPDEEKKYYLIYFDNSNEEIKRYYLKNNEKVNIIKIIIDYGVSSFKDLFAFHHCISSITFKKFNNNDITDMSGMFSFCKSLKEINLSKFNTNKVTNMSYMFNGCSSLIY